LHIEWICAAVLSGRCRDPAYTYMKKIICFAFSVGL
jgi:hypothetical protein